MKLNLIKRGDTLHIRKRVPKRYHDVEPRQFVWLSLHTDSESIARVKAPKIWADLIEAWEAKLAGDTSDAEARFEAARELAAKRGFRFMSSDKVAALPLAEVMARVQAVAAGSRPGKPDLVTAAAVLGGAKEPAITISRALKLYWEYAAQKKRGKSDDQIRRWENPRKKAIKNIISVIGDKPIGEITRDDMIDFREWWWQKIDVEGLTPNSGNKDLVHVGSVLNTVNERLRLNIQLPLGKLSFSEDDPKTRPPFSEAWIREKLLAPGALAGLNTEARCIVIGMINTGYRPSEGAELRREQIRLDADIPHISIEPIGRTLKSPYSKRIIPLVGVSLDAFKQCPDGFPRYRDSPNLSATVNSFLRENGLMETDRHTLYGLRHSFEDRMLAAEVDERIRRDLFGHSLNRERYGKGATLEHLQRVVKLVAI